jgi:glycosyltransferase involved in cell wall biosynthesis
MDEIMNPKVSVLMPAFNAEEYIAEAIESILNQSYEDFEFLIVEDGSTDATAEIVERYRAWDSRIKVFSNKENKGLVYSLNKGLRSSVGEYIARMDADDISVPHRLERQVNFMDSHLDVVVSSAWMKTIGKKVESTWESPVTHEKIMTKLFFHNCVYHPVSFIRKKVLDSLKLQYNQNFPKGQDYKLWVDLSEHGKFANIPEILHRYRIHEGQKTRKKLTKSSGNKFEKLNRRKNLPGVRETLLKKFLERNITLKEIEIHAKLFFEIPFTGYKQVEALQNWIRYLKRVNEEREKYVEPDFSELLDEVLLNTKAKSFKYSSSDYKQFNLKLLWKLFFSKENYYKSFSHKELGLLTFNSLAFRKNRWYAEEKNE